MRNKKTQKALTSADNTKEFTFSSLRFKKLKIYRFKQKIFGYCTTKKTLQGIYNELSLLQNVPEFKNLITAKRNKWNYRSLWSLWMSVYNSKDIKKGEQFTFSESDELSRYTRTGIDFSEDLEFKDPHSTEYTHLVHRKDTFINEFGALHFEYIDCYNHSFRKEIMIGIYWLLYSRMGIYFYWDLPEFEMYKEALEYQLEDLIASKEREVVNNEENGIIVEKYDEDDYINELQSKFDDLKFNYNPSNCKYHKLFFNKEGKPKRKLNKAYSIVKKYAETYNDRLSIICKAIIYLFDSGFDINTYVLMLDDESINTDAIYAIYKGFSNPEMEDFDKYISQENNLSNNGLSYFDIYNHQKLSYTNEPSDYYIVDIFHLVYSYCFETKKFVYELTRHVNIDAISNNLNLSSRQRRILLRDSSVKKRENRCIQTS